VPGVAAATDPEPMDPVLVAALAEPPADQREVVVLRFVVDLALEAVAQITRRRVGTVKALQHRGLAQLAVAVSPETQPAL
jgi:DNA-directed RNA polymerase specialized sigma24 family protein